MRARLVATFAFTVLCIGLVNVLAQEGDSEHFAEGRIALDKYHDCQKSLTELSAVSETGRQNPMWTYYMAKANECAGNLGDALSYYRQYAKTNPSPELTDKIADLQYQHDKAIADRKKADAEAQRVALLRSDLSGSWRITTCTNMCGVVFTAQQAGNSVSFTVSSTGPATTADVSVGDTWHTFTRKGDRLTTEWDTTWKNPSKVSDECGDNVDDPKRGIDVTVSHDGESLQGTIYGERISYDTCTVTKEYETFKMERID